jgi:hypothetical protein
MKIKNCKNGHKQISGNIYHNNGRRYCKVCRRDALRKWNNNHREHVNDRHMKFLYGVSKEKYDAMELAQNGVCAICKKPESRTLNGKVLRLSVDHDHNCCPTKRTCGKCVRGLLCSKCNFILGNSDDNPDILNTAINYLRYYSIGQ